MHKTTLDNPPEKGEPALNLPPAVMWLSLAFVALHIIRMTLPANQDALLVLHYGFVPLRFQASLIDLSPQGFLTLISYMGLHADFMHLAMNLLLLIAAGSAVERSFGVVRFFIVFILCGIAAALMHYIFQPDSAIVVIGASGGLSGLFAAALYVLYKQGRLARFRKNFTIIMIVLIAMMIITGILNLPYSPGEAEHSVAWIAHVGGFIAGLVIVKLLRHPKQPAETLLS